MQLQLKTVNNLVIALDQLIHLESVATSLLDGFLGGGDRVAAFGVLVTKEMVFSEAGLLHQYLPDDVRVVLLNVRRFRAIHIYISIVMHGQTRRTK